MTTGFIIIVGLQAGFYYCIYKALIHKMRAKEAQSNARSRRRREEEFLNSDAEFFDLHLTLNNKHISLESEEQD